MKTTLAVPVLLAASMVGSARGPDDQAATGDAIFAITSVHRIRVSLTREEWNVLQTSSPRGGVAAGRVPGSDYRADDGRLVHIGNGFGGYFPWVRADVRIDAAAPGARLEFKDAGLRYKGNYSFSASSASAPLFASLKLKLDVHGATGRWDGERTFNLHAGVLDGSRMREAAGFALFRAASVPAPRTAYAELIFTVPGIYQDTSAGLFTLIEDVNQRFLARVLPPGTGLLMKPEGLRGGIQSQGDAWAAYPARFRPDREATESESARVMDFARLVSQPDVPLFRSRIGTYLDVDLFLRFLAVNAFIVNTDSYLGGSHNYYFYLDPRDNRFRFIPWDLDLSMGMRNAGNGFDILRPLMGDHPLIYWLLDDPAVAARYRGILKDLSASVFAVDRVSALMDSIESVRVPGGVPRGPSPREFLRGRAAYLQQVVAGWK